MFRLEREFTIKIPRGELFPDPSSRYHPVFTQDGRLTDEGLAAMRSSMPFADLEYLDRDGRQSRIEDLYTVGLLVCYIRWRLGDGRSDADLPAPDIEAMGITTR